MKETARSIPHAARRLLCAQVLGIHLAMSWAPAVFAAPTTPPATLAQVPQFLQLPPAPNVFVTLDNSGSMALEYLPAGDDDNRPRLFPHPITTPYSASGSSGSTGRIDNPNFVRFEHTLSVARARSSVHNQMYYNPRIRYRPWKYADTAGNILSFPEAADPPSDSFALYHPVFPAFGGLDLAGSTATAGSTSYTARLIEGDASSPTVPFALYYNFDTTRTGCDTSDPFNDLDCFERVEIKPSVSAYRIPPGNQRGQIDEPGCAGVGGVMTCDYAAEFRNFANWFQYYRSRTLMARGAVGNALAELGPGFRVGFGLLNPTTNSTGPEDGFSSTTVRIGVRPFEGANRKRIYDLLNNHDVASTTPSARALYEVGQYFDWKDGPNPRSTGPWSDDPQAGLNEFTACRQSYHVYVTDGYWNQTPRYPSAIPAAVNDADTSAGPEICRPTGAPVPPGQPSCYQYKPSDTGDTAGAAFAAYGAPGPNNLGNPNNRRFVSAESQTLADIAMYYWYRDLQPAMPNIVTPSTANPAFWQNLSLMAVSLGLVGTKTHLGDAFLDALDGGNDAWPTGLVPDGGDSKTIDDLWHAAVNSRGRMLLANNPQEFAARLAAALQEIRARAAVGAAAAASTAFLDSGNGVFTAEFLQGLWTGNLYRREIDPNTLKFRTMRADGTSLPRDSNNEPYIWRASDMLPAPNARRIFTLRPDGSRVDFVPESGSTGVSSSQMTELSSNPSATAADVINYLRGDRSKELSAVPPGNLRDRPRGANSNVLGSIINSSPLYVKDDDFALDLLPTGTPGRDTYQAFVRANAGTGAGTGRTPLIWVGSNAGMFHAFNADTGAEVFAYVPRSIIRNLPELTRPDYAHRYFVDGVPASGDAYIAPNGIGSASWRTVVIGSLGAGGRSVFAIDATDPATLGAGNIMWDLDETSLSSSSYQYLGHVFGPAFTARAKNGKWVAVFGNGPESDNKRAALFIVDLETGNPIRIVDTGDGDSSNPNGLSTPAPAFDANQQLIGVYAGDLRGNLWKFDLSSTDPASWNVALGGQPLFQARNLAGQRQPIFARPLLRRHPNGGAMVIFGTGKLFSPGDKDNTDVQTLYGVWDKPSAVPLDANFRGSTDMVQQAITLKDVFDPSIVGDEPTNYRLTNFPVNYGAGQRGWYLDLGVQYSVAGSAVNTASAQVVTPRERMVISPIQLGINLIAQSFVPSTDPCSAGGDSFQYRLDPLSGSSLGTDIGAVQVPGSFGLLPFYSRTGASVPPPGGGGGTQPPPPPPPPCPPGATCTCPAGFDYIFSTGIDGSISGRCVPRGGIGAVRTWRQIIE
jgi:type IV pilus assembly protein PilY1